MEKTTHAAAIGARIRARRKALGMNQGELAKAVGAGQSSIAQYESGRREMNASELLTFAEILDVPISYFYSGTNPYTTKPTAFTVPPGELTFSYFEDAKAKLPHLNSLLIAHGADEEQLLGYFRKLSPAMKKTAMSVVASLHDNERHTSANINPE